MKINLIFSMIALFVFVSFTQTTFATETEQEPGPPQISEPSLVPEPIKIPDPFPEESDLKKNKKIN